MSDEKRFTYIDYEFEPIANFIESYDQLLSWIGTPLYDYGDFKRSAQDNMQELKLLGPDFNPIKQTDTSLGYYEGNWLIYAYSLGQAIHQDIVDLIPERKEPEDIRSYEDIKEDIKEKLKLLEQSLLNREREDKAAIEQRRAIDKEGEGVALGFGGMHPIEEFHRSMKLMVKRTNQGLRDVGDYQNIVLPKLKEYRNYLINQNENISEEDLSKKIAIERLSILNDIRLKKEAKVAGVAVAMFPSLPFTSDSFDRMVFSYSISTHVISEMTKEDFESWWSEIERVLKLSGKAYIFPMQQGFPYGRKYDSEACFSTLDAHLPENGGHFTYELKDNTVYNDLKDASFSESTLVITKV